MAPKKSDQGKASASAAGAAQTAQIWTEERNGLLVFARDRKIPYEGLRDAKDSTGKYIFGDPERGCTWATLQTRKSHIKTASKTGGTIDGKSYKAAVPTDDYVKTNYPKIIDLLPKDKAGPRDYTLADNKIMVKAIYRDGYKLTEIANKKLLDERGVSSIQTHWRRALRPDILFNNPPISLKKEDCSTLQKLATKYRVERGEKNFDYVKDCTKDTKQKAPDTDRSDKASTNAAAQKHSRTRSASPDETHQHQHQSSRHGGEPSKRPVSGINDGSKPPLPKKKSKTTGSQPEMPDIANMHLSEKHQQGKEKVKGWREVENERIAKEQRKIAAARWRPGPNKDESLPSLGGSRAQ